MTKVEAQGPACTFPILEMRGVTKRFPGVLALDEVSLSVAPGEVLALIGENGAGKSTLMKVLGGVHAPDEGAIFIAGQPVRIQSVADSHALGIGFVHQELNVLDNLDVAGNVLLGREALRAGPLRIIDSARMNDLVVPFLEQLGLEFSPDTPLNRLSIGQQQLVEIAKALSMDARIIIMDEPTSSLTLQETEKLLDVVRDLRRRGIAVIYISHRLSEITLCADRVVVLRDGRNAGELQRGTIDHDAMVALMVGRELTQFRDLDAAPKTPGYFKVFDLISSAWPQEKVSFEVARGEILGFAGLVGAGRSEMAQTLFGIDRALGGELELDGKAVSLSPARHMIRHGIFLAPEDRKQTGLILDMCIRENITLASLKSYATRWGLIRQAEETRVTEEQIRSIRIKASGPESAAITLSGGNQQKIVLGKWLSMAPRVLILDEPTRGIDVGAKQEIYRLMNDLAHRGVAIIMISSDMEEVLGVSDRIAVMHQGAISGFLDKDAFSEESVMHLAVRHPALQASAIPV